VVLWYCHCFVAVFRSMVVPAISQRHVDVACRSLRRQRKSIVAAGAIGVAFCLATRFAFVAYPLARNNDSQNRVRRMASAIEEVEAQLVKGPIEATEDPSDAETTVSISEPQGPGVGRQSQAVPGPMTDGTTETLKRKLLRVCAAGNRGFSASDAEKDAVLGLVDQLEEAFQAPIGEAARVEALMGSWSIVYTTSPDLDSLDRLPLPLWRTGRVGQSFFAAEEATNEIQFVSPLGSRLNQTVECSWDIREPDLEEFKVALTFLGSSTKLAQVTAFDLPIDLPSLSFPLPPGTGVFRVPYVDDEILVQRTRAGPRPGINVLLRDA